MFNHFSKEKSDFLRKKDKSKKGFIDKDIKDIVKLINSKKDYYTTSSCAGRIVLLEMKSKRKDECNWIFTKHDKVNFSEITKSLNQYNKKIPNPKKSKGFLETSKFKNFEVKRELPLKVSSELVSEVTREPRISLEETCFSSTGFKHQIWFKQQPLILHVACRNLDAANKLLNVARKIFRRAGIIGITRKKVMIEIIGDGRLETIIADKNFVADENYIRELVRYANENFEENKSKSERFLKFIKKI